MTVPEWLFLRFKQLCGFVVKKQKCVEFHDLKWFFFIFIFNFWDLITKTPLILKKTFTKLFNFSPKLAKKKFPRSTTKEFFFTFREFFHHIIYPRFHICNFFPTTTIEMEKFSLWRSLYIPCVEALIRGWKFYFRFNNVKNYKLCVGFYWMWNFPFKNVHWTQSFILLFDVHMTQCSNSLTAKTNLFKVALWNIQSCRSIQSP